MPHYDLNINDYQRIFSKQHKKVFMIALLATGFSIFFAHIKPSIFQTSSTVKVERKNMIATEISGYIPYDYWGNIETQAEVITSFPVIRRAAILMKVIPAETGNMKTISDPEVLRKIRALNGKVSAHSKVGTNIIQIDVTSTDPEEASNLANAVAAAYKKFALDEKKSELTKTRRFIQGQLDRSKQSLSFAEKTATAFEQNQKIPSVQIEIQKTIDKMTGLELELEKLRNREKIIRRQTQKLEKHLTKMKSDNTGGMDRSGAIHHRMSWISEFTSEDPGLQELNSRLIELQISMENQLKHYKKDHPAIMNISKKIGENINEILLHYRMKLREIEDDKSYYTHEAETLNRELNKLPVNQMRYSRMLRDLKLNEELYALLTTKLQETLISEAGVSDDVTIMSIASVPERPINKNMVRFGIVGFLMGLLLGVMFAVFNEMVDTSIGTIEDVERTIEVPVLATIPHINIEKMKEKIGQDFPQLRNTEHLEDKARLITHFDPKNPAAEAYRILRTNIQFLSAQKKIKTILITSTSMQEGKTTTLSNLAVAFAQDGKKVLAIGANLRRPSIHRVFGIKKGDGISDILINNASWKECVHSIKDFFMHDINVEGITEIPGLDNLHIITFGKIPPNPSELLSSEAMDNFLNSVRDLYDLIIIDAPPLLPVADSSLLARKADGVILVYQVGRIPRNSLLRSKERLQNVDAHLLGMVLNDIRPEVSGASYVSQYYMHYYGDKDKGKKHKPRKRFRLGTIMPVMWPALFMFQADNLLTIMQKGFYGAYDLMFNGISRFFIGFVFVLLLSQNISLNAVSNGSINIPLRTKPYKRLEWENRGLLKVKSSQTGKRKITKEIGAKKPNASASKNEKVRQIQRTAADTERKQKIRRIPNGIPARILQPGYCLQLASFHNREDAIKGINVLRNRGYNAYIEKADLGERGTYYRVCVGMFNTRKQAVDFRKQNRDAKPFRNAICRKTD